MDIRERIQLPFWRYLDEAPGQLRHDAKKVGELCPACSSGDIAKVKGCLRCLKCGFKQDCNGW